MTRRFRRAARVSLLALLTAWPAAGQQPSPQIPLNPRDLVYPPLSFTPPDPARLRQVLSNKVVAYMVEDHELPLVSVTVLIRGGAYLDPAGKTGLASLTASQMRSGGTEALAPEEFDEEADFLAANIGASFGPTSGSVSASFLAKDTERALALLFQVLRTPRFQQDRLDLAKAQRLQALARRNDSTDDIEAREWARLIRGTDFFSTAPTTKASLEAIARDDLVRFHQQVVQPANFVVATAGDFNTADMRTRLEAAMAGWAAGAAAPPVPKPAHTPVPGLYLVDKPDVNQGRVTLGHLGITRDNPDEIAVDMMNEILGGGSFTSRVMTRVRSDEGLAYEAGTQFSPGTYYEGTFSASFQSKSESVARAAAIVLDEVERIRKDKVSAEELETVRNYAVEVFPRQFSSAGAVAGLYAGDELTGRDPKYWLGWRDRVRAVTAEDIQRVAQKYLHPDRLVVLTVGDVEAMLKGDPDRPSFALTKIAPGGKVTRIPLPDPVTMVYPPR